MRERFSDAVEGRRRAAEHLSQGQRIVAELARDGEESLLGVRPCLPLTLHPAPYTLHPAPCTLHPTPSALHPTP